MAARDYTQACTKFEESLHLQPALGTLHNLADCYEHLGKLATAWSKYVELADKATAAGQTERARVGKKHAAELAPRLSNLVINVTHPAPGLEVKRDGTAAGQAEWGTPIPADAGTHTIEATAPGRQPWSASVVVEDGAKTSAVTVPELQPVAESTAPTPAPGADGATTSGALPPAPPTDTGGSTHPLGTQKILALVSGGIGLVGVGVGSYFGVQSMSKHNDASKGCSTMVCANPSDLTLWSDAHTAGDWSTAAFIVGGLGLAGGAVLWFTAPRAERSAATGPRVRLGLTGVQISGAW